MAARQLCSPPAILFYRCSLDLFSPPNLRGRSVDRHQTFPRVRWWPRSIEFGQKFGWPIPTEIWRPKNKNFGAISDNFATWSRISPEQQDIVNRKTALQTTDTTAQANLIWCTLVHKWRKIGPVRTHPTGGRQAGHARHLVWSIYREMHV